MPTLSHAVPAAGRVAPSGGRSRVSDGDAWLAATLLPASGRSAGHPRGGARPVGPACNVAIRSIWT